MDRPRDNSDASGEGGSETPAIRVDCYAGHQAEESPRRFFLGRREVGVSAIIDRWLDPGHSYFKVRGDDGGIYILRYDRAGDRWQMILFNSDTRQDMRLSSTRE